MSVSDSTLTVLALAFAAMGVGALAKPDVVTRQFGMGPLEAPGRSEVRAVYGGFGLAMAAMLIVSLASPALRRGVCLTIGLALAGMAAGRLVSWAIDRRIARKPLLYLALEAVAAALLLGGVSSS